MGLFYPELWIPISILAALGFAAWSYLPLYKIHNPRWQVLVLYVLRSFAAFLICVLLAHIFISHWRNFYEKPVLWVAVDRSKSMTSGADSQWCKTELPRILKSLQAQTDVDCRMIGFGDGVKIDSIGDFKDSKTNLQQVFQYLDQAPEQTPKQLLIISDGIYNDGGDPRIEASRSLAQIDCIGIGDTALYPDAWVSHVICNRTAKTQNTFNVEAEFRLTEGLSSRAEISLWENQLLRGRSICNLVPGQRYAKVSFSVFETLAGMHNYTVKINPLPGEQKLFNNQYAFSVNIIDTRLNVILAYQAPHPDIPVLAEWFKQSDGMAFSAVPAKALSTDMLKGKLILFHGFNTLSHPLMEYCKKNGIPYWEMLCSEPAQAPVMAEVLLNPGFKAFQIPNSKTTITSILDPVVYITPKNSSDILNAQVILNAQFQNQLIPVMYFTRAQNVLRGHLNIDGIWKWSVQEGFKHEGSTLLRNLFLQAFQYSALSIRNERFTLHIPNNLNTFENIEFNAEVYDRVYNFYSDADITLDIGNAAGKHTIRLMPYNSQYVGGISALAAGQYTYLAKAQCADTLYTKQGSLTVYEQAREMQNLQADLSMLRQLAAYKNGFSLHHPPAETFMSYWNAHRSFKPVMHTLESEHQLIDFKIFGIILLSILISEWILRKKWLII